MLLMDMYLALCGDIYAMPKSYIVQGGNIGVIQFSQLINVGVIMSSSIRKGMAALSGIIVSISQGDLPMWK